LAPGCQLTFDAGANQTATAAYNARFGTSFGNIGQVIGDLPPPILVLTGSSITYRLTGTTFERSLDGQPWAVVLNDVLDFQVERIFDLNGNGTWLSAAGHAEAGEVVRVSDGAPLPVGASAQSFLGMRLGILTFGQRAD